MNKFYDVDVDKIIDKLMSAKGNKTHKQINLSENDILALCSQAKDIFINQPILLELEAPLKVCGKLLPFTTWIPSLIDLFYWIGDIHGQFYDLLRLFEHGGVPPESNYLFLGDYVDRGKYSIETVCLLFAFKVKYPENFFLLRGNHECSSINRLYGFYDECKYKIFGVKGDKECRWEILIQYIYIIYSGLKNLPILKILFKLLRRQLK